MSPVIVLSGLLVVVFVMEFRHFMIRSVDGLLELLYPIELLAEDKLVRVVTEPLRPNKRFLENIEALSNDS